eukprot:Tbor_TRINITY_DN5355_c5_g1::TRINITY_DN5355_c5_g1_i1::g.4679::m.4679
MDYRGDNLQIDAGELYKRNIREETELCMNEMSRPSTLLSAPKVFKYFLFDAKDLVKLSLKRLMKLSKKDVLYFIVFYVLVVTAQAMMIFGMNFWIHSFGKKYMKSNAYVSMIVPAVCWMAFNICIAIPYEILIAPYLARVKNYTQVDEDGSHQAISLLQNREQQSNGHTYQTTIGTTTEAHVTGHHDSSLVYSEPKEDVVNYSLLFWIKDKKSIILIIIIGILDASTGLLCCYSIPHVNIPVQQTIGASTCILIYIGNMILYPQSACPFHWLVLVSFSFLIAGCICSIVIEMRSEKQGTLWGFLYLCGIVSSATNMILQGRFMSMYNGKVSPIANRLAVLTGDFIVQIVVTVAMFPLDFTPWFGRNVSAEGSWEALKNGLHCLANTHNDCPDNTKYFFIFVLGVFCAKWLSTIGSLYSPTLYGFCIQLTNPINALLLIIFPALHIHKSQEYAGWTLATLLLPIGAPIFFIIANEGFRQLKEDEINNNENIEDEEECS